MGGSGNKGRISVLLGSALVYAVSFPVVGPILARIGLVHRFTQPTRGQMDSRPDTRARMDPFLHDSHMRQQEGNPVAIEWYQPSPFAATMFDNESPYRETDRYVPLFSWLKELLDSVSIFPSLKFGDVLGPFDCYALVGPSESIFSADTRVYSESGDLYVNLTYLLQTALTDSFEERILDPDETDRIIRSAWEEYIQEAPDANPDDFEEFASFLRDLYSQISLALTDKERLLALLAEVLSEKLIEWLLLAPPSYVMVCVGRLVFKVMLRRTQKWLKSSANGWGQWVHTQLQQIFSFFETRDPIEQGWTSELSPQGEMVENALKYIKRSRIPEIASATGLSPHRVKCLLGLGPYAHERSCFYRYATGVDGYLIRDDGE